MFGDVANSGSGPALEAAMRFAAQRHKVLQHNIANITTPNFVQSDVSVPKFQEMLRSAIDRRREGGNLGELHLGAGDEVEQAHDGGLTLHPKTANGGILFHDRNNRSLEKLMQDQMENATMFRICADLLKSRTDLLRTAISERI